MKKKKINTEKHLIQIRETATERTQGLSMPSARTRRMLALLGLILFLLLPISFFFLSGLKIEDFSLPKYFESIRQNVSGFSAIISGAGDDGGTSMILCRLLIVALTGAALSVSGSLYQGIFRNPMASPGLIGAQAGGVLSGAVYIFFFTEKNTEVTLYSHAAYLEYFTNLSFSERYAQQISIFCGSLLAVFAVTLIARTAGGTRMSTLILLLTGSVLSSFIQSVISLLRYYMIKLDPTDSRISAMQLFMLGSFNQTFSLVHLLMIGIPALFCISILLLIRTRINLLIFAEEEARLMGVHVNILRIFLIAMATVLSAITVSFCGPISFVGLIVPHITRRMVGSDYRTLLPASALLGAVFLLAVYSISGIFNASIYINLFSSFIGGPFFIALIVGERRKRNAAWS